VTAVLPNYKCETRANSQFPTFSNVLLGKGRLGGFRQLRKVIKTIALAIIFATLAISGCQKSPADLVF